MCQLVNKRTTVDDFKRWATLYQFLNTNTPAYLPNLSWWHSLILAAVAREWLSIWKAYPNQRIQNHLANAVSFQTQCVNVCTCVHEQWHISRNLSAFKHCVSKDYVCAGQLKNNERNISFIFQLFKNFPKHTRLLFHAHQTHVHMYTHIHAQTTAATAANNSWQWCFTTLSPSHPLSPSLAFQLCFSSCCRADLANSSLLPNTRTFTHSLVHMCDMAYECFALLHFACRWQRKPFKSLLTCLNAAQQQNKERKTSEE